jgi:hypothetical protein
MASAKLAIEVVPTMGAEMPSITNETDADSDKITPTFFTQRPGDGDLSHADLPLLGDFFNPGKKQARLAKTKKRLTTECMPLDDRLIGHRLRVCVGRHAVDTRRSQYDCGCSNE